MMEVKYMRLRNGTGLPVPALGTVRASGFDLHAANTVTETLYPGNRCAIPTGFAFAIPPGWEGQVRPRSGLALRKGITVLNSPGTIDSDYRGEVQVILYNTSGIEFKVQRGDRIAQLVFQQVPQVTLCPADALDVTERGAGGFGSTGVQ